MILRISLLVILATCTFARSAAADTLADFREALAAVELGAPFAPAPYLDCVRRTEDGCRGYEGKIDAVHLVVDIEGRVITRFYIGVEGVRLDKELLPVLEGRYGTGEKKQELRDEAPRPGPGLATLAGRAISYEWYTTRGKIVLFSQDRRRVVLESGEERMVEPMRTYVSGEAATR